MVCHWIQPQKKHYSLGEWQKSRRNNKQTFTQNRQNGAVTGVKTGGGFLFYGGIIMRWHKYGTQKTILPRKCIFCNKWSRKLSWSFYTIEGSTYDEYRFHRDCLKAVIKNHKHCSSFQARAAVEIIDNIKGWLVQRGEERHEISGYYKKLQALRPHLLI